MATPWSPSRETVYNAHGPIIGLKGLLYTGQLSPADREPVALRIDGYSIDSRMESRLATQAR